MLQLPGKGSLLTVTRFQSPSSVAEALTIGRGNMPEQALSIAFSPAMRSKWTLSDQAPTRPIPGPAIDPNPPYVPFSPYNFGYAIPGGAPGPVAGRHIPPGMLHPSVANPTNAQIWPQGGGQQTFSGLAQSHAMNRPSVAPKPVTNPPHFVPNVHNPPQQENAGTLLYEPLQTKPPAEEALDEIHDHGQSGFCSPGSDGKKSSETKARVSLPSTPSKVSLKQEEPSEAQHDVTDKSMKSQTSESAVPRPPSASTSGPNRNEGNHGQVYSAFSENEIKERRQAWAKIPMPLNPRRSRNFTPPKTSSDTVEDDDRSRVSKSDKREVYAARSEMSTPTQIVTFTPDTGSVYEPSSEKPESPQHSQKDTSPPNPTISTERRAEALDNGNQDRAQMSTGSSEASNIVCQTEPDQANVHNPGCKNVSPQGSDTNQRSNSVLGTQPKGRGKGLKTKSKKKKSKHKMVSQGNESGSQNPQQIRTSPEGLSRPSSMKSTENRPRDSLSPTKRHYEDSEQRSTPGSSKRSKNHGNGEGLSIQPQHHLPDESDSPDEDARGRRGFRMGRGGSLRLGKTRRPRPILPESTLVGQFVDAQISPPSSDFAFQCQNVPAPSSSSSNGPDNGAMSRLNPKAQEFVSPSRAPPPDTQVPIESSEDEPFQDPAPEDATNRTRKEDRASDELSRSGIDSVGASAIDESVPSEAAISTPSRRRALSEAIQQESPESDRGIVGQGQRKTSGKGSKRAKGKERAATLSAKIEKGEGAREPTQDSPRTPKQQNVKTKKPGLINDDWPSLPASRDRAPSKLQTPPIWGAKTKAVVESGDLEQGSPVAKG